jgi:hypothetical protein
VNQARGAGDSRIIGLSAESCRPLRGLENILAHSPGADAPGFMPSSAPWTENKDDYALPLPLAKTVLAHEGCRAKYVIAFVSLLEPLKHVMDLTQRQINKCPGVPVVSLATSHLRRTQAIRSLAEVYRQR